jgi:hypothetical protein
MDWRRTWWSLGFKLAFSLSACALAPAIAGESIPVVRCAVDGQTAPGPAPASDTAMVSTDGAVANRLSYYQGAIGPRVLAPRGWHCKVWEGSSGFIVVVIPEEKALAEAEYPAVPRDGIFVLQLEGGTAGRFSVAAYAERFFPDQAPDFISLIKTEATSRGSPQQPAPIYASDTYNRSGPRTVEFSTPPSREGLGTDGPIRMSRAPIVGRIQLQGPAQEPSMQILSMRLPNKLRALEQTILHEPPADQAN